jgi:hypothetical protein
MIVISDPKVAGSRDGSTGVGSCHLFRAKRVRYLRFPLIRASINLEKYVRRRRFRIRVDVPFDLFDRDYDTGSGVRGERKNVRPL